MALTIADATKRYNNPLVDGIAATIVNADPLKGLLPWIPVAGDGTKVNWETTMGGADILPVNGSTSGLLGSSDVETKFWSFVRYAGQANVDNVVALTSQSAGVDPMAYEIASKAKNIGEQVSTALAQGGPAGSVNSLKSQVHADLAVDGAAADFGFGTLDAAADALKGAVDFYVLPRKLLTRYKALLRTQPGATETVVITDPYTGAERIVLAFEGIPVFGSDYFGLETAAGATAGEVGYTAPTGAAIRSSVYAGKFDDGSKKNGVSFIYPSASAAGLVVNDLGHLETTGGKGQRIELISNFVNFSKYGLSRVYNVK